MKAHKKLAWNKGMGWYAPPPEPLPPVYTFGDPPPKSKEDAERDRLRDEEEELMRAPRPVAANWDRLGPRMRMQSGRSISLYRARSLDYTTGPKEAAFLHGIIQASEQPDRDEALASIERYVEGLGLTAGELRILKAYIEGGSFAEAASILGYSSNAGYVCSTIRNIEYKAATGQLKKVDRVRWAYASCGRHPTIHIVEIWDSGAERIATSLCGMKKFRDRVDGLVFHASTANLTCAICERKRPTNIVVSCVNASEFQEPPQRPRMTTWFDGREVMAIELHRLKKAKLLEARARLREERRERRAKILAYRTRLKEWRRVPTAPSPPAAP